MKRRKMISTLIISIICLGLVGANCFIDIKTIKNERILLKEDEIAIEINEENFPDENFRQYLEETIDLDETGYITPAYILSTKNINVKNKGISTLQGIEYFTELTDLNAADNSLDDLDISVLTELKNLYLANNNLTSLNLSNNRKLKSISLNNNQLESIDVSLAPELSTLYVAGNQLTELDLSNNLALKSLSCNGNQLTELDLSRNTILNSITIHTNNLISLNVGSAVTASRLNQNPNTIVSSDGTYDLRNLSSSILADKLSNVQGATIDGTVLSDLTTGTDVTYDYDIQNGQVLNVVLNVIAKEANAWVVEPTIEDWEEEKTPNSPTGEAAHGTIIYTYSNSLTGPFTTTIPTTKGRYYLKAYVAESEDYRALEKIIEFNITEKIVPGGDTHNSEEIVENPKTLSNTLKLGTSRILNSKTFFIVIIILQLISISMVAFISIKSKNTSK